MYLTIPTDVATALGLDPTMTYRVKKFLYGLPDAGRAYYMAYSKHLEEHGYKRSGSDSCLFIKLADGLRTYAWIHVDDTFVVSTHKEELALFQDVLRKRFKITVKNEVAGYLGVQMKTLADGSVELTQPKLLQSIFEEFHPERSPRLSSATAPQHLSSTSTLASPGISQKRYLHLLGALIYLTKSRPDIATAVSFGGTKSASPTEEDFDSLLHIVKYLWNTQSEGLILHRGINPIGSPLTLTCYVDASYLTHADAKSHSGYCLSFGTIGTFYSRSSKQTLVATSSTHAEMRALYTLVIDIIYVEHLCQELGRPLFLPAIIFEDNRPVIDLTASISARLKKSKHFLMLIEFVKEQVISDL